VALIPRFTTGPGINSLTGAKFEGTNINATLDTSVLVSPSPYSLKLTQGAAGAQAQTNTITAVSEIYGHFYFQKTLTAAAINELLILYQATNVSCSLRLLISAPNADKIGIYDGTGAQVGIVGIGLSHDTWYRIEIRTVAATTYGSSGDGRIHVKVYDAAASLLAELDTGATLNNVRTCSRIQYTNGTKDNNTDYYFAHMIWCDTTGGEMDGWIGDSRVTHHTIDGIGTYNDGVDTEEERENSANITYATEGGVGT